MCLHILNVSFSVTSLVRPTGPSFTFHTAASPMMGECLLQIQIHAIQTIKASYFFLTGTVAAAII